MTAGYTGCHELANCTDLYCKFISPTPVNYLKSAFYNWQTKHGNIISWAKDSSSVKVDRSGTYYLSAAVVDGCQTTKEFVVVLQNGHVIKAVRRTMAVRTNTFKLHEISRPAGGVYVLTVKGQNGLSSSKITW